MDDSANPAEDLEAYADELIRSGRYDDRDAVMKEALRLLKYREARLKELDEALARGLADADAGRTRPIEEVMAEFEERYAARRTKRQA